MRSANHTNLRPRASTSRRWLAKRRLGGFMFTALLFFACSARAFAHEGPPYPILVDKTLGPCVVSVWADPDVGTGTFFITLEPTPGGKLPDDVHVEVGVRPVSGRLQEAVYAAEREDLSGRVQYKALVPFDAEELWHVRVRVQSSQGGGEAATDVEATPPGYGRWDLLLYLLPFVAVGLLWLRAISRSRRRGNLPRLPVQSRLRASGEEHDGGDG
ncbi:MAG TPA: hypothetical protein VFA21_04660 [Pyrinomonadaceae bacterium]|nr:hypothetical protein [Pyrinomonadaceae bacterium]